MTAAEIFLAAAVLTGIGVAVATHLGLKRKASGVVSGRNHLSPAEFSALFHSPPERKWAPAIRDQLRSYIPVDPALVRPDDKLCAELQLAAIDGLDANGFVADVEKLTGVRIPDAEAERMLTLRDVISYVAAREQDAGVGWRGTLMAEETPAMGGMTVNERLHRFGLMPAFDDAVRSRKVEAVIAVLRQAQCSQSQAEYTATTLLANPERYGY